ncbi:Protein of unknown function [Cotesia congregata]|uniref:Uncharacterized protein n=1 Tax=Cotesia congregata TaxID=51543 RepID=A0A8J2HNQ7_COTCN|nr:Protein of unknown function [Cotesia congregata]
MLFWYRYFIKTYNLRKLNTEIVLINDECGFMGVLEVELENVKVPAENTTLRAPLFLLSRSTLTTSALSTRPTVTDFS